MNKIILVFIGSIFAINSFAQTFRNEFDRYEFYAGGQGQGFSFHSNVRGELNNAESIYLEAYIEMFKATKDKRYLDKFIIHSKRVIERRDDNITLINFNELEGFPAQFYNPNTNAFVCKVTGVSQVNPNSKGWSYVEKIYNSNQDPDCQYNTQRVLHSAALTYPMAEFVYFMQTDPDFMNVANEFVPAEAQGFYPNINPYYNIQRYSDYAVWLKSKVTETIQYHECFWQKVGYPFTNACTAPLVTTNVISTSGNVAFVVQGGPGAYVHDCSSTNVDALNMQCAMGKTLIMMYLVSVAEGNPNSTYLCHITDIAFIVRDYLQLNSQDNSAYTWCHTYNCSCIEDIAHASLIMSFADLCHQYNQYIYNAYNPSLKLFYSTDMQMFANTFVKHIYQSPGNYAANTFGSNSGTCNNTDIDNIGGYTFLTKYNPYAYHIIADRFQGRAIYNLGGDLTALAQLSLYQKEISDNPAFNNPYQQFFNPVAVQINQWPNPNITFPSNPNWMSSAGGDFNGDGNEEFAIFDYSLGKINIFSLDNSAMFQQQASATNSPNTWRYLAAADMDGLPGDELLVARTDYIDMLKQSGNNLNVVTSLYFPAVSVIAAGNIDGNAGNGNECIATDTNGNIFLVKYTGSNFSLTYIGNLFGIRAITTGDFDGNPINGDEIAIASGNIVQVWRLNNANTLTFLTGYFDPSNPVVWGLAGITGGDFDGDGIDEIIAYNEYFKNHVEGSGFYILKIKNGTLSKVGQEFFPYDQKNGHICSFRQALYPDRDVLVAPANRGGIVIFNMDGLCPNLYLNNQVINDNYTINNIYTGTNNNYTVDYHANNNLVASNFTVSAGSSVDFMAGNTIILKQGFHAEGGSDFHAYITPSLSCGSNQSFRTANNNTPKNNPSIITSSPILFNESPKQKTSDTTELNIEISPNPNDGRFIVQLKLQDIFRPKDITVYNSLGQMVYKTTTTNLQLYIDISSRPKGLYYIKVQSSNNLYIDKIVIQ